MRGDFTRALGSSRGTYQESGVRGMSGQRVALVCDDEAAIRAIVAAKLRTAGFEVLEARDGEEGLHLARTRTPDIVVTDLQMPNLSGLEMCQELHAGGATHAVPAILLTARGHVLEPSQLASTSIRRVVPKPFSARELLAMVQAIVAERSGDGGERRDAA